MANNVRIDHCCGRDLCCIRFHNTVVSVHIDNLLHIMADLVQQNQSMFDVALQLSLRPQISSSFCTKPEYKLIFGRTILLFSEREIVEFLAQMWQKNPMLMHWAISQKQECS